MYNIKLKNIEKIKLSSKIKLKNSVINYIKNFKKNLKIYILGGGCHGLKYEFCKKKTINKKNILLLKNKNLIITDIITYIYILGCIIIYNKNINKNKIEIKNPNIKTNCNCGLSFKLK